MDIVYVMRGGQKYLCEQKDVVLGDIVMLDASNTKYGAKCVCPCDVILFLSSDNFVC